MNHIKYLCLLICLAFSLNLSGSEKLFDNNRNVWKIYKSTQVSEQDNFAINEFRNALKKISGINFEFTTQNLPFTIIIGTPASCQPVAEIQKQLKLKPAADSDQIAIYLRNQRLYLTGNNKHAVIQAVFTFLRNQLGCRWLWPGEDGSYYPSRKSFLIPPLAYNYQPPFRYRGWHICGHGKLEKSELWMVRNGGNFMRSVPRHSHKALDRRKQHGIHLMYSTHNATLPVRLFKEKPEIFALHKGKRFPRQVCWSNKEAEDLLVKRFEKMINDRPDIEILSIFPGDVNVFCKCPECKKLDASSCWHKLLGRITARLHKKYPKLKFGSLAYHSYIIPPPNAKVSVDMIEYCLSDCCWIHPFPHKCAQNNRANKRIKKWLQIQKKDKNLKLGLYGYELDIFTQPLIYPLYYNAQANIKKFRDLNAVSILPECSTAQPDKKTLKYEKNCITHRLLSYLMARWMWNPDIPAEDLIKDFARTVYGPAAGPICKLHLQAARYWNNSPRHIVSHYGNKFPSLQTSQWLSPRRVDEFISYLDNAEKITFSQPDSANRTRALKNLYIERRLFENWFMYIWEQYFPERVIAATRSAANGGKIPNIANSRVRWDKNGLYFQFPDSGKTIQVTLRNNDSRFIKRKIFTAAPDNTIKSSLITFANKQVPGQNGAKVKTYGRKRILFIPWQAIGGMPPRSLNPKKLIKWQGGTSKIKVPYDTEHWLCHVKSGNDEFPSQHNSRSFQWGVLNFSLKKDADNPVLIYSRSKSITIAALCGFMWGQTFRPYWVKDYSAMKQNLNNFKAIIITEKVNNIPEQIWKQNIVPAVKAGTLALIRVQKDLPLDKYFNSPDMAFSWYPNLKKCKFSQHIDDAQKGAFKRETYPQWKTKLPQTYQFINSPCRTPSHGFTLAEKGKWQIIASAITPNRKKVPILAFRKVGKGILAITSAPLGTAGHWTIYGNLTAKQIAILCRELLAAEKQAKNK